jgi:predicted Zn-dependent protease
MNSEAELAAVLGHEIAHVTAKHALERLSKAQLATLGLEIGIILEPDVARYRDLATIGLGILLLKYNRDDERQADQLGLRYSVHGGYDPRPMSDVFTLLERVSRLQQAPRLPGWLSSHPTPENRRALISEQIAATKVDYGLATVGREKYLEQIDGILFGTNPREGFFRENVFFQPDLRFQLQFPRGWRAFNQKQQVYAVSPQGDAWIVLTLAQETSGELAAGTFARRPGVRPGFLQRRYLNTGSAAWMEVAASTPQGETQGVVAFLEYGGRVYQILGYALAQAWWTYSSQVGQSMWSFAELRDQEILAVQPQRIDAVELPSDMTLKQFAAQFPSVVPLETVALINQVEPGTKLRAGRLMKRVVTAPR